MEGSKGQRAASATLLNQAMSFAAVAGITMRPGGTEAVPLRALRCEGFALRSVELPRSGAMQTATFKNDLDNAAQEPTLSLVLALLASSGGLVSLGIAGGPGNAGSTSSRRAGARLPRCRQHVRTVPAAAASHGQWHPLRARIDVPVASYACGTLDRIEGLCCPGTAEFVRGVFGTSFSPDLRQPLP